MRYAATADQRGDDAEEEGAGRGEERGRPSPAQQELADKHRAHQPAEEERLL